MGDEMPNQGGGEGSWCGGAKTEIAQLEKWTLAERIYETCKHWLWALGGAAKSSEKRDGPFVLHSNLGSVFYCVTWKE